MNKYIDENTNFMTGSHNYFVGFLNNGNTVYFISKFLHTANNKCDTFAASINTTCIHVQQIDIKHAAFVGLKYLHPGDEKKMIYHEYSLDTITDLDYNTSIITVE